MQAVEKKTDLQDAESCRRRRRAQTAPMAVGYQLMHLVEQNALRAIVIADDVGMPLAHAGDAELSVLLAESAMWSGFATAAIDEMTLERIQQRYPEIDVGDVASQALGRAGVQVLAIGAEGTAVDAVRHAREGIARICGTTVDGADFLA